jgi:hypothetical protein
MLDVLLLLYCGAVGFVAAGIAASFYKLCSGEPVPFSLFGGTIFGLATSFLFDGGGDGEPVTDQIGSEAT